MNDADDYNRSRLDAQALLPQHVTELVRHWQATHGLDVDGKAGPRTVAAIDAATSARTSATPFPAQRCYPLRALADGRLPMVTSGFHTRNPSRPTHNGCDLFYQYRAGDPPMKDGDHGRAGRWWIPDNTMAVACAAGRVVLAGSSPTGYRVWIDHGQGWHVGYFHLTRLEVHVGDVVEMGTPVGIVGDNPVDNDARHLHFELYFGELSAYPKGCRDPEIWLLGSAVLTTP